MVANLIVVNLGPFISGLAWTFSVLLYFFPGLATTPSNKIDPKRPTFKGIPLATIYTSVEKIENDPYNPVILFFEGYILLIDSCHVFAYLWTYIEEYFQFPQNSFPSVAYSGRNGKDLSADLMNLANMIGVWQFIGSPISVITVIFAPFLAILYGKEIT